MHIEENLKLDFKDVLIRPKRSTLTSRSQVELQREFVFHHSKKPITVFLSLRRTWIRLVPWKWRRLWANISSRSRCTNITTNKN